MHATIIPAVGRTLGVALWQIVQLASVVRVCAVPPVCAACVVIIPGWHVVHCPGTAVIGLALCEMKERSIVTWHAPQLLERSRAGVAPAWAPLAYCV